MHLPRPQLWGSAGSEPVPYGYVARQPILTADEKVFGYELLFRDGVEDYFREKDVDAAHGTRSTNHSK
ncbi:MAG: hypothetical protein DMG93_12050 [Acidobacteria bacterium]|nr:MAG: hypothetical protein DMG93_12050 [Acidobacteriota bacterium]